MEITIGTIVRLKSGGPAMTVSKVTEKNLKCIWFDDNQHIVTENFHRDVLTSESLAKKVEAIKEKIIK